MKLSSYLDKTKLQPAQVLSLGFFAVILIGAIILNTPFVTTNGEIVGFENALFTSTSAVCVTGLIVVDTSTYWNVFGQTVILILIQIGGLGFMTMATLFAMIVGHRISLKGRIMMQESINHTDISGVIRLAKRIVFMTFLIEAIGAFLLSRQFIKDFGFEKGIWYSVFHSVSAFCNAGFDIMGNSLVRYVSNTYVNFIIMALIVIGGIGFVVIMEVAKFKSFKKLSFNSKIVISTTAILIFGGAFLFYVLERHNPNTIALLDAKGKFLASMFGSVTTRTAGFNTIDTASMMPATVLITMVLMFIGGSPGSTAGGVKTTTITVVALTIISIIKGKQDTEAFGRRISKDAVNRALGVLGIALIVLISVVTLLSITEKSTLQLILFETVSAFGTVGLSMGLASKLSIFGKIIISFTMFMGRVGALTIIFAATTKLKNNEKLMKRYPKGKISIG